MFLSAYCYITITARLNCKTAHLTITKCAGLAMYACFCFIVFKLRQSYLSEFRDVVNKVQRQDVSTNQAKALIQRAFNKFRDFRRVVGIWATWSFAVGTFGVFLQLSWNYSIDTSEHQDDDLVTMFAVNLWSEKLMFLIQPFYTIGGMNADYIWRKLMRMLTETLQDEDQSDRLHKILGHMKRIDTSIQWIQPTIALTLAGFYLGLHVDKQDLYYWASPGCNSNGSLAWF